MNFANKIAFCVGLAALTSACFTPEAARNAGKSMATHTTAYKTGLDTFVANANQHRQSSAVNLGISDTSTRKVEAALENLKLEWQIAGNKSASSTLAALSKHADGLIAADTEDDLTFFASRRDSLAAAFGKVEYSTKKLAGSIKVYEALSKDEDNSLDAASLLPILDLIAQSRKLDGTVAGKVLEKATEYVENQSKPDNTGDDAGTPN